MFRRANFRDYATMESCFLSLKTEWIVEHGFLYYGPLWILHCLEGGGYRLRLKSGSIGHTTDDRN